MACAVRRVREIGMCTPEPTQDAAARSGLMPDIRWRNIRRRLTTSSDVYPPPYLSCEEQVEFYQLPFFTRLVLARGCVCGQSIPCWNGPVWGLRYSSVMYQVYDLNY